jgi:predicted DNA-binding transcriptional regulator YafY
MSRPATRVLALLELLQARGLVGGAEIAARLEVDQRTVRRYAQQLVDMGIPVEGARGRYGGYRLRPGYKLPPLMLTDGEAAAVVLGLVAARQLGLTTAEPALDGALAKVLRVLPAELRERVRALEASLGFTRSPSAPAAPPTSAALALAEAVRLGRRVRVRYRDRGGGESERELDAYGIVFHAGRWYLAALDHRSGEVRTFRADRVGAVELLDRAAPVPPGFDAAAHVARSLARVPWRWEVEVLLETTVAEARQRIAANVAELEEQAEGVLMRARAERLDGMAQMLAGLGWPFVVRHPAELRDAVRALAARLATQADRPG